MEAGFASEAGDFEGADLTNRRADDAGLKVAQGCSCADPFVAVGEVGEELGEVVDAQGDEFACGVWGDAWEVIDWGGQ